MKDICRLSEQRLGLSGLVILVLLLSSSLMAQNPGYNTVYNGSSTVGSKAFIDASGYNATGDICARVGTLISGLTTGSAGTVVDARGILPSSGSSQPCTSDPFSGLASGLSVTVLLPEGTIVMSKSWAIPSQSQLIGEGPGRTILQATTSSFSDPYASSRTAILHMGKPSISGSGGGIDFEIRIEHLTLDGQGQAIDGVDNQNAEELSYVNDVAINNVDGYGLFLANDPEGATNGTANHSGPYTNILFQTSSATSSTACINVQFSEPRALYGITCIANASSNGAIWLDGGNVAVEDVRIDGFVDGIRIGSQTGGADSGQTDLLMNITGTTTVNTTPTTNLVHIYSTSTGNLTLAGLTSLGTDSIMDGLTGADVTDGHVGIYIVGQPISGGYSRFTNSPNWPNWAVGATSPSGGTCPANGSLFSYTLGGSGSTLWACVNNGTALKWTAVE
jgi:hypothetical protein